MSTQLGTIDHGGKAEDVILAVLNHEYNTNFTLDDFGFTKPVLVNIPNPTHNSMVKVGPKAHTGYYGFRTIFYNRIHISELGIISVPYEGESYLTQLLPKINEKYGILIRPQDVFEKPVAPPLLPFNEVTVQLDFRPDSLGFYGGDLITLGTNDPSIIFDSPINKPFANETVFFINSSYKLNDKYYLEYQSVSLAADYERQRSSTVVNYSDNEFTKIAKQTLTEEQYVKLQDKLPFIYSWSSGDSKNIRGINIYGDVLELDTLGETWSTISNVLGLTSSTPISSLEDYKDSLYIKKVGQGTDGKIYILKKNTSTSKVELLSSQDDGVSWTPISITTGTESFTNYLKWDTVEILDSMVIGTKAYFLVKDEQEVQVEVFNINTASTQVYKLNDINFKNTNIKTTSTNGSIYKFVSPVDGSQEALDVIALTALETVKKPVLAYFKASTSGYESQVVPNSSFEPEALLNGYYDVGAYKKPFDKDPTKSLLSVEVTGRVTKDTLDLEHYLLTKERTEDKYLSFGLTVYNTVVDSTKVGNWNKTSFSLGAGHAPSILYVEQKGKRANYIHQGESGIYKVSFSETDQGLIEPKLDKVFNSGNHSGYNKVSVNGAGQWQDTKLAEYPGTNLVVNDYPNQEINNTNINYSFVCRDSSGSLIWLTAFDSGDDLETREVSSEYGFMGKTPVATATMDDKLYYWSQDSKAVYVSDSNGTSWKPYASVLTYYEDARDTYDATALLKLEPENFKSGSFTNDKLIFEVEYSKTLNLVNKANSNFNDPIEVKDHVLYELDSNNPDVAAQFSSVYSTRGFNVLSINSPRKVIFWDTDEDNDVLAYSKYTSDPLTPYNESINADSIDSSITDPVVFIERDLVYVGLKYLVYTETASNEFKLHFVKSDDTINTVDLQESSHPLYQFRPTHKWHLWDYADNADSYVPFVMLGFRKIALVERVDTNGDYSVTLHSLVIPNDNNGDLEVIPMLSNNRRDYLLYQKGNGVFKVDYAWDVPNRTSTISLVKIFDLTSRPEVSIINGSQVNTAKVKPYGEVKVPVIPPHGTVLGTRCDGIKKIEIRADGRQGSFEVVVDEKSTDCGYVPPTPGHIGGGGAIIGTGP